MRLFVLFFTQHARNYRTKTSLSMLDPFPDRLIRPFLPIVYPINEQSIALMKYLENTAKVQNLVLIKKRNPQRPISAVKGHLVQKALGVSKKKVYRSAFALCLRSCLLLGLFCLFLRHINDSISHMLHCLVSRIGQSMGRILMILATHKQKFMHVPSS